MLRHIQLKKSLEPVAVYDVDPNKVGKDAEEIFGYEKAGVVVLYDRESLFSNKADVVLYYAPNLTL